MKQGIYERFGKRVLDLTASSVLLIIVSPVLLVVSGLSAVLQGFPVLFRQERPGLHGVPFFLLKFRTMTTDTDQDGNSCPDSQRLTTLGRFLRRTSLDELPELVNVLAGHMSLVGPRPLLMEYLPRYSAEQRRRHLVRPGITGLAQVNGRNLLSWNDKFSLDTYYVDHISLRGDLAILGLTVLAVITARGISQDGVATAEKFTGSHE